MAKGTFKKIISFILTLISLIVIDSFWIGVLAAGFYKSQFGSLMTANIKILPAILVWLLITIGIRRFVLAISSSYGDAAVNGAIFGFLSYGIYDLTNYATIQGWPMMLVIVDMIWGMILCSMVSVISFFLKSRILKA